MSRSRITLPASLNKLLATTRGKVVFCAVGVLLAVLIFYLQMADEIGPLLPGEVLKLFPYSRRLAEMRFLEATGNTIQEEIISVRIAHAKHLLLNPFMRLDAVAAQCGYESDTTFRRIFKRETGFTLREWQKFRGS